jgi:hypothetical protein
VGGQSYTDTTFDGNLGGEFEQFNLQNKGAFGGAQFGHNWVVAPNVLLGIEADGSVGVLIVRGRVGYFWNSLLLYATGGWAWSIDRYSRAVTSAPFFLGWPTRMQTGHRLAPAMDGRLVAASNGGLRRDGPLSSNIYTPNFRTSPTTTITPLHSP